MKSFLIFIFIVFSISTFANEPVWQGKGRIAISSDGNEHDHDDWAATPLSLALLASQGLQDNLVLYTYSDHVWGSNIAWSGKNGKMNAYQQMNESALGGKKWFGFNKTNFVCAVDDPEAAYNAMAEEINKSSKKNPLIIIGAGPMQVIGEGIKRSKKSKRKYVHVISHSGWNNNHSDKPSKREPTHEGWIWDEMKEAFGNKAGGSVHFDQIADQNGSGSKDMGFNCLKERFEWIKTSKARNHKAYKDGAWDWLFERIDSCKKNKGKNYDPSDCGMVLYLLTGNQHGMPKDARTLMENPVYKN